MYYDFSVEKTETTGIQRWGGRWGWDSSSVLPFKKFNTGCFLSVYILKGKRKHKFCGLLFAFVASTNN